MMLLKFVTLKKGASQKRNSHFRLRCSQYTFSWSKIMHWSCLFFLLSMQLFISPCRCLSQPKDTLYFYNETKIVGELLTIRLGRIEFDADDIGIVKVKNNKVQSINATSHSFRIETVDGNEIQGYLTRSNKPGMVFVNTATGSVDAIIENITELVNYGKTFKSRLVGNFSTGFTYTKSSEIGRFNLDGLIKYNTNKGITQLKGDMIITYDSVQSSTERANLAASHSHTFAPLWDAIFILKYQRNLELGLERRWQQALGVGRQILINQHQQVTVVGGVAINQEYNEEEGEINTTEAMLQAYYNLYSFAKPNITLSFYESMFVSIKDEDRYRLDGDITLDYEVMADFYISLQFYHNFDSSPPATDEPNIDYGFVAGLRYKF